MKIKLALSLILIFLSSFNLIKPRKLKHDVIFIENNIELKVLKGQPNSLINFENRINIPHCSKVSYRGTINSDSLNQHGIYFEEKFFKINKIEIDQGNPVMIMKFTGFPITNGDRIFVEVLENNKPLILNRALDRKKSNYNIYLKNGKLHFHKANKLLPNDTTITSTYIIKEADLELEIKETHKIQILRNIKRQRILFESHCL